MMLWKILDSFETSSFLKQNAYKKKYKLGIEKDNFLIKELSKNYSDYVIDLIIEQLLLSLNYNNDCINDSYYVFYKDKRDNIKLVTLKNEYLVCSCATYITLQIHCRHIIMLVNKYNLDIKSIFINKRWKREIILESEHLTNKLEKQLLNFNIEEFEYMKPEIEINIDKLNEDNINNLEVKEKDCISGESFISFDYCKDIKIKNPDFKKGKVGLPIVKEKKTS